MRICVTGPECSGKTTLAQQVAASLKTIWVPEASRLYAEQVSRALTVADYEPIARQHVALADAAAAKVGGTPGRALVLDTDLLSTIVYARHYYGETTAWLEREARERLADLYLLCDVDVPWVADGIRDRPDNREAMLDLFRAELTRQDARVAFVRGSREARLATALDAIAIAQTSSRPRIAAY